MRGLLICALLLFAPRAEADEWGDPDGLGLEFEHLTTTVSLDRLIGDSSEPNGRRLTKHLPDLIGCFAGQHLHPRTSEPYDGPKVTPSSDGRGVDVSALNIRDVYASGRYEFIEWRVRVLPHDGEKAGLQIQFGQRVVSRSGAYLHLPEWMVRPPTFDDYRGSGHQTDNPRAIIGRTSTGEAAASRSKKMVTQQFDRLIDCVRDLVEFGELNGDCIRSTDEGAPISDYEEGERLCQRLSSIRSQLGSA